jgi:hypothetical protein
MMQPTRTISEWTRQRPKWRLEVLADDDSRAPDACLFLETRGQRNRRYSDTLSFFVARTLADDLARCVPRLKGRPRGWLGRHCPWLYTSQPCHSRKHYWLELLRKSSVRQFSSVTVHSRRTPNTWLLELSNREASQFVIDLTEAVEEIERRRPKRYGSWK